MSGAVAYRGATLFDGELLANGRAVIVEGAEVAAVLPEADLPAMPVVDLPGGIIAPGFIDPQVNGGAGRMLGEAPGAVEIAAICEAHAALGATGILPTLITDTPEVTRAVVEAGIAAAAAGTPGFLGLHLEGPHLDPRRHGAHDPALIRPMTEDDLALLTAAARRLPALLVTVAPESATPGQIAALARAGAVVSLGHSDTGAVAARVAFAAGARAVTHLFNAMSPLGHREPGLVGAALSGDVHAGLIADGVHVAPEVIGIALRAKGTDRVFLVSDAMAVAGTDLTEFTLRGRPIHRRDGRLTLADGTLAGADIDLPGAVRVLVRDCGVQAETALRMATSVPARLIGATGRGIVAPGAAADLVHLDAGLTLRRVWRAGAEVPVYRRG